MYRICLALLPFTVAATLIGQETPQTIVPSGPVSVNQAISHPGPPPADATAPQLEATADELRAHNLTADALDYYNAALKRGGDPVLLRNKMGIAYLSSTQVDHARKEFEYCVKHNPDYADGFNNLGAAWYAKAVPRREGGSINEGDLKKAIRNYEKAIELRDDSASYHSNLGTAYFARKEYDKASDEYQRAMQLDPDVFERRSKLGIQALMLTQSDRAKFNFFLARLYARQGSFDLALKCLRKAMEDGYNKINDVYNDTNFAALRKDPRFNELMSTKPVAIPQ
ncbi:MAG TPA: tetratricopeptide repeat protein [Terriglobales bacterium]|nr:tetratricopeptide repeat protein [Terriglobales bacterium]